MYTCFHVWLIYVYIHLLCLMYVHMNLYMIDTNGDTRYMYTWFYTYLCALVYTCIAHQIYVHMTPYRCMYTWLYTWLINVETPDICTHDSIHICVKWSMYQSSDIHGHMILQMYVHMIVYMIDTRVDTRCKHTWFYTSSPCTSI